MNLLQYLHNLDAWSSSYEKTAEGQITSTQTVKAGGPGSGRHPAYGTFKEGGRAGDSWYYHGDGNHMVRVQDREDRHGSTKVFEGRPGSKETQVFKAYRKGNASQNNDYHDFMKERYGIEK